MKKIILFIPVLLLALCVTAQPPKGPADPGMVFGAPTTADNAINVNALPKLLDQKNNVDVKVSGVVSEVCKAEGCWIRMEAPDGPMLIKMKDHKFLVPLSLNGKTVVVQGTATRKETSVEMLRHYAEDAGKSKTEIEAIKEPKVEITMQATGILVM